MNPLALALLQVRPQPLRAGPGAFSAVSPQDQLSDGSVGPGSAVPSSAVPSRQNGLYAPGRLYGVGLGSGGYTFLGGDQWRGAQGRVKTSVAGPPQGRRGLTDGPVTPQMTLAAILGGGLAGSRLRY